MAQSTTPSPKDKSTQNQSTTLSPKHSSNKLMVDANVDTLIFQKFAKARIDLLKEVIEFLNVDLGETDPTIKYDNTLVNSLPVQGGNSNIGFIEGLRQNKISEFTVTNSMSTTPVRVGNYIQNLGKFNVEKAVEWGVRHCHPGSQTDCAKYVRFMLEAGGINTAGHPVGAQDYDRFLPTKGFKCIADLYGNDKQNEFTRKYAQAGDIAVMHHGKYGHICMYTGGQWISDFAQNRMWVYSGNGRVLVFRYNGL